MSAVEPLNAERSIVQDRKDSKTAAIASQRLQREQKSEHVCTFERGRDILLSKELLQGGGHAESFDASNPDTSPVFYLDGVPHREKRGTIARFFTPKAISTRYQAIIERETTRLLDELRREGRIQLDVASFELTVAVAGNIVGLTNSDIPKMAGRLNIMLSAAWYHQLSFFRRIATGFRKGMAMVSFYWNDIMPALAARRKERQDDILSHLIDKKASRGTILIECMTYAAAGMVTTREFIVVAAWHLLDRPELRREFLEGDEEKQVAILLEILRIEPIGGLLYRRTDPSKKGEQNELYALDIRAIHLDEKAVGGCPHALDPERAKRMKANGSFLSFGAGAHHCPGRQVALHETRIFLQALLSLPGIRLERAPDIGWSELLMSYELRGAIVACDKA